VLGIAGGEDFLQGLSQGFEENIVDPVASTVGDAAIATPQGAAEFALTGDTELSERTSEAFVRGVGDVVNVPQVALGLDEAGEVGGYLVNESLDGRGGQAGGEVLDETVDIGEAFADQIITNPETAIPRLAGSVAGSAGAIGAASRFSGTAGRATSFAIQPGEEIATSALGRAGLPTSLRGAAGSARSIETPNLRGRVSNARERFENDFEVAIERDPGAGAIDIDPAVNDALAQRIGQFRSEVREAFSYTNALNRGLNPATAESAGSSEYRFYTRARQRGLDPEEVEAAEFGPRLDYTEARDRGLDPEEFDSSGPDPLFEYTDAETRGVTGQQRLDVSTQASIAADRTLRRFERSALSLRVDSDPFDPAALNVRQTVREDFDTVRESIEGLRNRGAVEADRALDSYADSVFALRLTGDRRFNDQSALESASESVRERASGLRNAVSNPGEYTLRIGPRRPDRVDEPTLDVEELELDPFSDTERAFLRLADEDTTDGAAGQSGQLQGSTNVNDGPTQQTVTRFQTRSDPETEADLDTPTRRDLDDNRDAFGRRVEPAFDPDEDSFTGVDADGRSAGTDRVAESAASGVGLDAAAGAGLDTALDPFGDVTSGFDGAVDAARAPTFEEGVAFDQSQTFDVEREFRQRTRLRGDSRRRVREREAGGGPSGQEYDDSWFTDESATDELFSTGIQSGDDVLDEFWES
jgi:hypothetical protein